MQIIRQAIQTRTGLMLFSDVVHRVDINTLLFDKAGPDVCHFGRSFLPVYNVNGDSENP